MNKKSMLIGIVIGLVAKPVLTYGNYFAAGFIDEFPRALAARMADLNKE